MATSLFTKLLGDPNQKEIQKLQPIVDAINDREPEIEQLDDVAIMARWQTLRQRVSKCALTDQARELDTVLPEAFALVREAAKRTLGLRHYDVQLIGGLTLHQGKIAEMRTGEGKTLVATLPLALNALTGRGAHLVTPNDYLSKVGAHWMGPVYSFLGLTVAAIGQQGGSWRYVSAKPTELGMRNNELGDQPTEAASDRTEDNSQLTTDNSQADQDWPNLVLCTRKDAYAADITYGTNNEFGFDYLRDNMAVDPSQLVQRDLIFAIVDEVDSILIDEARTPLIISASAEDSGDLYAKFATFVSQLKLGDDYSVEEKERYVAITAAGIKKMETALGVENIYDPKTVSYVHHLEEALKAKALFTKDKDYVIQDGEVIIVDEFTGRLMNGRRYSEGLHQAIEAKEGVEVKQESQTMATITFQNLFRMYGKLAGMTGTAETEAEEFAKIYSLDVLVIPTHRPIERIDHTDVIYKTEVAKISAIVADVKHRAEIGQPVLVGTASIEKSELISSAFKRAGIAHSVLNAKQHEREAKIILQAGEPGRVTVATNMAGRGVDIVLGGAKPERDDASEVFKAWEIAHQQVLAAGGLAVIGTERHEARRIDNQLRGRSGRQGDPGESMFYISMEDDLMRIFGGERLKSMMDRLGLPDDEPITNRMISSSIEQAQRRVEGHNFDIRKHLVEYDDVMNAHREAVYKKRRRILDLDGGHETWLHAEVLELLHPEELDTFQTKISAVGEENFRRLERVVYLRTIDTLWVQHLSTMQHLREGIGLSSYAQKDPLVEYKEAAYGRFQMLRDEIENQVVEILLKLTIQTTPAPTAVAIEEPRQSLQLQGAQDNTGGFGPLTHDIQRTSQESQRSISHNNVMNDQVSFGSSKPRTAHSEHRSGVRLSVRGPGAASVPSIAPVASNPYPNVGRNELCPCGSGKKFKKCHGQ